MPQTGFYPFIASLQTSKQIELNSKDLLITIVEGCALAKLPRDEWINYEVSLALGVLCKRLELPEVLPSSLSANTEKKQSLLAQFEMTAS